MVLTKLLGRINLGRYRKTFVYQRNFLSDIGPRHFNKQNLWFRRFRRIAVLSASVATPSYILCKWADRNGVDIVLKMFEIERLQNTLIFCGLISNLIGFSFSKDLFSKKEIYIHCLDLIQKKERGTEVDMEAKDNGKNEVKVIGSFPKNINRIEVPLKRHSKSSGDISMEFQFFQFEEDEKPLKKTILKGKLEERQDVKHSTKRSILVFKPERTLKGEQKSSFALLKINGADAELDHKETRIFTPSKSLSEESFFSSRMISLNFIFYASTNLKMRSNILQKDAETAKVCMEKIIFGMILQKNPEISAFGSSILSEFAKDKKFIDHILDSGGLDVLLRQSLARNQGVAMSAVFPIAALVRNIDFDKFYLDPKKKEIVLRTLLNVANSMINLGNYNDALVALKDCQRIDKENLSVSSLFAMLHLKLGEQEKAQGILRNLVKKVPFSPEFRTQLASSLYNGGNSSLKDREEAIVHLKKGLEISNSSGQEKVVLVLADILSSLRRHREAVFHLKNFCGKRQSQPSSKTYAKLSDLLEKMDDGKDKKHLKEGLQILEKQRRKGDNRAKLLTRIASYQLRLGDYEGAKKSCDLTLVKNPENRRALEIKARIHHRKGEWKEGATTLSKLLSIQGNLSVTEYFLLARAEEKIGKEKEGMKHYGDALKFLSRDFEKHKFDSNVKNAIGKIMKDCSKGHCPSKLLKMAEKLQKEFDKHKRDKSNALQIESKRR